MEKKTKKIMKKIGTAIFFIMIITSISLLFMFANQPGKLVVNGISCDSINIINDTIYYYSGANLRGTELLCNKQLKITTLK